MANKSVRRLRSQFFENLCFLKRDFLMNFLPHGGQLKLDLKSYKKIIFSIISININKGEINMKLNNNKGGSSTWQ
tara:strand:- start:193 stop:417 length:225 start_codon:yes stop_codon:yes gene_type:complete